MDVILVKPPLVDIPDILTRFAVSKRKTQAWKLQKRAFIDPNVGNCWPGDNLSLGYLAAYLQSHGCSVKTLDAYLLECNVEELVREICTASPKIVGISILQAEARTALQLVRNLRIAGYVGHVVVGGYFPTFCYDFLLRADYGVDCVVIGEGEVALLRLWEAVRDNTDLKRIPGLAIKQNGRVRLNGEPEVVEDLNSLPFPVREWRHLAERKGYVPSVSSSRGCDWGKCSFCCIHPFTAHGRQMWRGRSTENIVLELQDLCRSVQGLPLHVNFTDENFFPTEGGALRAKSLARSLICSKTQINFLVSARVCSVDAEVFAELRKAGLSKVFLGVETGVDRLLRIYRKGTTKEDAIRAIDTLRIQGITVFAGTILFDPFSSFDEVVTNYRYFRNLERLLGYFDLFRYSRKLQIYVGTLMYEKLTKDNRMNRNPLSEGYTLTDPKVSALYSSITAFQENCYEHYDRLGQIWERNRDDPSISEYVWEFADIFHTYVESVIGHISRSLGRGSFREVEMSSYLAQMRNLVGAVLDLYGDTL